MRMHNDYMAESMKNHPERLKGFISINPKFKKEAISEIERCAKLGFSGIGELGPAETAMILMTLILSKS